MQCKPSCAFALMLGYLVDQVLLSVFLWKLHSEPLSVMRPQGISRSAMCTSVTAMQAP